MDATTLNRQVRRLHIPPARSGPEGQVSLMVTVKAYPAISRKHGEVVCVAGIRTDQPKPRWVRLWPIGFRDLPFSPRFQKYQEITLLTLPSRNDDRPESLRPCVDTLQLGRNYSAKNKWAARRRCVEPLIVDSMCEVLALQEHYGTSLAAIRPGTVHDFVIEAVPTGWKSHQQAIIDQPSLFAPDKSNLRPIPYKFKYRYTCDRRGCKGHEQSIIDWELAQAYLKWSTDYGEKTLDKLRHKWLDDICGRDKDTMFFVGNVHLHPRSFLVLGTFWPPTAEATNQLKLEF